MYKKNYTIALACIDESVFSLINLFKYLPDDVSVKFHIPNKKFQALHSADHIRRIMSFPFNGEIVPIDFFENKIEPIDCLPTSFSNHSGIDLLIFTSPYFMPRSGYEYDELAKKNIKTAYFPYGTEFMGKGYDNWIVTLPHVDKVSLLFASSPYAAKHYTAKRGALPNLRSVGNPELDILFNKDYEKGKLYPQFKNFVNGSYTFLYTPHWTVFRDPWWSTFLEFGPKLLDFFRQFPRYRLLLRPHPCLFRFSYMMNSAVKASVFKLLGDFNDLSNVMIDKSPSSLPAIGASNCLISDCSSIIQKFWSTGKPIIAPNVDYGAAQDAMSRSLYIVSSADELIENMQKLVTDEDPLLETRQSEAYSFSGPYDGLSGKRMADVLVEFLREDS